MIRQRARRRLPGVGSPGCGPGARPLYVAPMRVLAGTSGYSYAAWKGRFYDAALPASRMLSAYAARLPAVEINATFYRMPKPSTLASWRDEVPPAFVFALKAPQRVTHVKRLAGAADEVGFFLRAAGARGSRGVAGGPS